MSAQLRIAGFAFDPKKECDGDRMKKTAIAGWLILTGFLFGLFEISSYAVLSLTPQLKPYLYFQPEVGREAYQTYLAERHPVLGWPGASWLERRADDRGARLSPANAGFGDVPSCIDVYGDSFAFGAEASDEGAWANVLADRLGCRVDNYGVGGYGVGQAQLRFELNLEQRPAAETIVMTLYPDNLVRNVNQWRHLLTGNPLAFKPAFFVGENGVELAPLFDGDYEAFQELAANPETYLLAEAHLPDASSLRAPIAMEFPYSLTVASLAYKFASGFRGFDTDGRPSFYNYPAYYDTSDGPSENKQAVTRYIIERFAAHCGSVAAHCVFVIMPDPELLFQRETFGEHDLGWMKPAGEGLIYLDGADVFADVDDICAHLTNPDACSGHFNAAGYARMAEFVGDAILATR